MLDPTRRQFLGRGSRLALGSLALESLLRGGALGREKAKAKRVIYLCQSGAPSQIDLFDTKPGLAKRFNEELPASIRQGQRLTTMTSGQARFPIAPSIFQFAQHGQSGATVS